MSSGGHLSAYHTRKGKIKPGHCCFMSCSDGHGSQPLTQQLCHLSDTSRVAGTVLGIGEKAVKRKEGSLSSRSTPTYVDKD